MQQFYYQQAVELLFLENPSLEDLVNALADLSSEYGYVYYAAFHGHRENAALELTRFTIVIEALKSKIKNFKD